MSPRNRSCLAYQFADDPESAVTMASIGSRVDSSRKTSIGLTGSAVTSAWARAPEPVYRHVPQVEVCIDGAA